MTKKEKTLTDLQKAFLYHLIGDAKGDFRTAMTMAGYSENTPIAEVERSLRDEIIEVAKSVLAANSVRASWALVDGVIDPTKAGISISMKAAQEVLDRVGVVKSTGDVTLKVPEGGLVILPAKQVNPHDLKSEDIQSDEA